MDSINQLLNEIETISQSYERVFKATGLNFNLFSILGMETKEVKTHSAFIAELLNPKGSHGQSDLFLKLFLNCMSIKEFDAANASVFTEYYIGRISEDYTKGGSIDILIKAPNDNVIMIENKIKAGEQKNQLLRYHNAFRENKKLLYLTLFGEKSKEKSSESTKYECISYLKDIITWLELCKKEVIDIPIIRESLSQYVYLIQKLTNQNPIKEMNKDIAKRITKDKASFESFVKIIQSQLSIYKEVVEARVIPVLKKIENENDLTLYLDEDELLNKSKGYVSFSFGNDALKEANLGISFMFNSPSKSATELIYGFSYIDVNKNVKHNESLQSLFEEKFKSLNKTPNWPCWNYYDRFRNWEDLNVLKLIQFGNFEDDIRKKVVAMLNVFDDL